jgi:hypothetical protein
MGPQGALVAARKTAAATFQFMQSRDTSSNISIILEVFSAMEYVPPVSRFLACGAASKLLACRGSTALYITPAF